MPERLNPTIFGILTWMKEHRSVPTSIAVLSKRFGVSEVVMQRQLESLQRHECARRGGANHDEWSITAHGLVRLVEGRFDPAGGFASRFELMDRPPLDPPPATPPDPPSHTRHIAVPIADGETSSSYPDALPGRSRVPRTEMMDLFYPRSTR